MKWRRDIIRGLQSGFPYCCIAWYVGRRELANRKPALFERLWKLECRAMLYMKATLAHIACPYHLVTEPNPKYFYCKRCDWYQRDEKHCFKCGKRVVKYSLPRDKT